MKKALLPLAIAAVLPMTAFADVTVYGKANVAYQTVDEDNKPDTDSELVSNASRIGVKGKEKLTDTLSAIYKFEYETQIDDGDKDGETFAQRNIYVGLTGDFGTVTAGNFDTPFKTSQKKIDQFNDLEGDIKNTITKSDNRESNTVQYSSPKLAGGLVATVAHIASEGADDNGLSASVAWDNDGLYLALAMDQDVEKADYDAMRLVAQYSISDLQLGALYEKVDDADGDNLDAYLVSASYKVGSFKLKAQYGEGDVVAAAEGEDSTTTSVGFDYKLSKSTKAYTFYTMNEYADGHEDKYAGVGLEVKF